MNFTPPPQNGKGKTLLREWKDTSQTGTKYLQNTYSTKYLCPEYLLKKILNSTIRNQTIQYFFQLATIWKDTLPKNLSEWHISTRKESQHYQVLGKQIKTTARYHEMPTRVAKMKKLTMPSTAKDTEPSLHDSIYMTFQKREQWVEKRSVARCWAWREGN